jgi:hypothetical protein
MYRDGWMNGVILIGMDDNVHNKKHILYSYNVHKLLIKDKEQTYTQYYNIS